LRSDGGRRSEREGTGAAGEGQLATLELQMKKGLYYNINQRRELGQKPLRPGQKGYPTAQAFRKSSRTAKKR
jgi:hypothetical protein